ncbi:hypothetical protein [Flavobacterium hibisci]|uniref:hypothetical protein n=1 Tax=Flavobacterium hibisci TaxID=1914462 RepID=UPI001CBE8F2F|nr:hypothetical protein [Flavobacterium hibisci]MBZ4043847.1 hypothetical protein [Flavobacterium hibisci]
MIKKLFFFLLIMASIILQGQTKYGVLIKTTLRPAESSESLSGNHDIFIGNTRINKGPYSKDIIVVEYDFINIIDNPTSISCLSTTSDSDGTINCIFSTSIPYNKATFTYGIINACVAYSEIYGIYLTQPYDTNICKEKTITLNHGWNWQYRFDEEPWSDFPSAFQAKTSISFKLTDLANPDGKKKINIKTGYLPNFSDVITYDIIPCSPALEINPPLTSKTLCSNERTGSVTLKFKEKLNDDEQLFLNLFKNSSTPILIGNLFVPKSSIINNEFTWTGFEKGNYIIKYQAQSISDNSENLNSSVVVTDEFIIESPTPLKFEIKKADNPICFGDLAEVSIAVTGGTGDYKFYVDGVEKTTPKPVKEADGYYHIRGLIPTAVNSIKVMDGNNCIEKTL